MKLMPIFTTEPSPRNENEERILMDIFEPVNGLIDPFEKMPENGISPFTKINLNEELVCEDEDEEIEDWPENYLMDDDDDEDSLENILYMMFPNDRSDMDDFVEYYADL